MDVLNVAVPDGGFSEVKEITVGPISDEDVLENIKNTKEFDLPVFRKVKPHGGTMIFVGGGPTLLKFLDELKKRHEKKEFIVTSNHTYDFLVDKGIIPNACLLMDPKEKVKDYVKNPQKETTFYCATVVNPQVIKNLEGFTVIKVLTAYGMGEKDIELQHQLYPTEPTTSFMVGGTMTPLRAMPLATMMGYTKIEYYGFDSCYGDAGSIPIIKEGEPGYKQALINNGLGYEDKQTGVKYVIDEPPEGGYFYAYKKKRIEDFVVAEVGDRRFITSPGFAYQGKQLLLWVDRLEGKLEIKVHGDSMSSYLLERHNKEKQRLRASIGDRRWTKEYGDLQLKMHEDYKGEYGGHSSTNRGGQNLEIASRAIIGLSLRVGRDVTVLDYGAGNGDFGKGIEKILRCAVITNYDPFHSLFRDKPEPDIHDFATCCDVMEHIEHQCVENTIRYIADKTRYGAYFVIALNEAEKKLPDGRNAHITLRNSLWWIEKMRPYFGVVETMDTGDTLTLILQKKDAVELLEKAA